MKHVLFDFFGTLVTYSESRIGPGFSGSYDVLQAHGAELTYPEFLARWDATFEGFEARALQSLREYSMDAVCSEFLSRVLPGAPNQQAVSEFRDTYLTEWNQGVRYIPGTAELLAALADDHALVIVTNTHHAELVHAHLRAMNVRQHFVAVVTSVECGYRKPSVDVFEHALELVGGAKRDAIFVGDSFTADYLGATNAGLRCLLIDPERRYQVPAADRIMNVLETRERLASEQGFET